MTLRTVHDVSRVMERVGFEAIEIRTGQLHLPDLRLVVTDSDDPTAFLTALETGCAQVATLPTASDWLLSRIAALAAREAFHAVLALGADC